MNVSLIAWLEIILEERFGYRFVFFQKDKSLVLRLPQRDGTIVFDTPQIEFQQSRSDMPCGQWDAVFEGWKSVLGSNIPAPALAQLPRPLIESVDGNHVIHYDMLGLTYWMLSRQEEVGRSDLDEHGRFPATSSHAYKHGYLERPIVDEWLDILGQVIQRQWPDIEVKKHKFKIKVSHDIDSPARYGFQSTTGLIRTIGGDSFKRKHFLSFFKGPMARLGTRKTLSELDPHNNFHWIMDISEKNGLKSSFNFMCGRSHMKRDADYEPEHPAIGNLIREIYGRGHEIGLHPSYNTYRDAEAICQEANRLRSICEKEGIRQQEWGARMHYLRWETPTTLVGLEKAGMTYDSTLGYADMAGFRCGTCFEYPAFDPVQEKSLKLRIQPLIAMDCTVLDKQYMGLGTSDEAIKKFLQLKNVCRYTNGCFTLLWHNTRLINRFEREMYLSIINN